MKCIIAIGKNGHIDAADHRRALEVAGQISPDSVVRFYFGDAWLDVKFEKDCRGNDCLQVRAMSDKLPWMTVQPSSGNTILVAPGG